MALPKSGGRTLLREVHYPHSAETVFAAALRVAHGYDLTLNSYDAHGRTITVAVPPSMFTWGETVTIACYPSQDGSTLEAEIKGKLGGQLFQAQRNAKVMEMLLGRIEAELSLASGAE